MPKNVFCANCGLELVFKRKVVKGNIIDVIAPHQCTKLNEPEIPNNEFIPIEVGFEKKSEVDKMFDSFKFVQKLNDLGAKTGDRRPEEVLRKNKDEIVKSSAPPGILNTFKQKED